MQSRETSQRLLPIMDTSESAGTAMCLAYPSRKALHPSFKNTHIHNALL